MPIDRSIFVDSWAWLALANKRDSWHQVAARGYEQIKADGWFLVTSDYVLDEVITSLFKRVNFDGALRFIEALISDVKTEQISLERIDEERFNYAWMLRNVYRDKADMSFNGKKKDKETGKIGEYCKPQFEKYIAKDFQKLKSCKPSA